MEDFNIIAIQFEGFAPYLPYILHKSEGAVIYSFFEVLFDEVEVDVVVHDLNVVSVRRVR